MTRPPLVLVRCVATLAALLPIASSVARADVKLPHILGSGMVLQRDTPLPFWGWAEPGEEVKVEFGGNSETTKADEKGRWRVSLPTMKSNAKGQSLTVTGKNTIKLDDILIGEVWVGAGQSNMEWPLAASEGGAEAINAARHPTIRLFHVPKASPTEPANDVDASWKVCSPTTVGGFSGVLYFFGLRLEEDLDVPVGLINSSWGGTAIQPWIVTGKGSGGIYNGMIAPLMPFAIRGVVWYQGEASVLMPTTEYINLMGQLIEGWRGVWGKDMPFYFVQIAPFSGYPPDTLVNLWEAQAAALKIPHTGMVVVTDLVPNVNDQHPVKKREVGNRLALWALAKTYGRDDLVHSGPLYKSMTIDGSKVIVHFAHVGGGLKSRDGKPLTEFEIAGEDGKFQAAVATIDGETVVVQAKGVEHPTQVRFGWRNTADPNLMNKEGLPASPFRTNKWLGGTGE